MVDEGDGLRARRPTSVGATPPGSSSTRAPGFQSQLFAAPGSGSTGKVVLPPRRAASRAATRPPAPGRQPCTSGAARRPTDPSGRGRSPEAHTIARPSGDQDGRSANVDGPTSVYVTWCAPDRPHPPSTPAVRGENAGATVRRPGRAAGWRSRQRDRPSDCVPGAALRGRDEEAAVRRVGDLVAVGRPRGQEGVLRPGGQRRLGVRGQVDHGDLAGAARALGLCDPVIAGDGEPGAVRRPGGPVAGAHDDRSGSVRACDEDGVALHVRELRAVGRPGRLAAGDEIAPRAAERVVGDRRRPRSRRRARTRSTRRRRPRPPPVRRPDGQRAERARRTPRRESRAACA